MTRAERNTTHHPVIMWGHSYQLVRKAVVMQTYTLGDMLRIEISLRDKTGIGYIAAVFNGCVTHARPSGGTIVLVGDGGGRTETKVELGTQITHQTTPGEYRCEYIQVQDTLGNHILHQPDIRFRVESIPGDHEGPELLDWRFVANE